ncbi:protein ImuB [Hephaestia caeni]|uniref:Protein ImuB n=1 Tax=Hephaestia caeni TaxID=645617 RepID=A0A397P6R6_9SPHN|nr:DNA polymerase Y family protein [Hephaestia caeni]RIA43729.1 protein ImuB [Hephaestia caeni]
MRLVACNAAVHALGLAPGLPLADARVRVPDLAVADADPAADARLLARLADACDRYTPMVALDPPAGLTLDITGSAHVFGGETAMLTDLGRQTMRWGVEGQAAFADTPEAAQALARHADLPVTDEAGAIHALPIAGLRLDPETVTALRRAGLRTIGDLADRPTAPLAARFGTAATDALARLLGRADSRLTPRRSPPALRVDRRFAEPIARAEDALGVIGDLAREAAVTMDARGEGGRRFAVRLFRSDGATRDLAVETSLPTRDPALVLRLFGERIDGLADPIDPGFGFDLIRLAVPVLAPLAPAQLALDGGEARDGEMIALIDRLGTRMGRARFRRLVPRDTHIPEQRVRALPAVEACAPMPWGEPTPGEPPLRPLHLFDPPQPIEVTAEVPDGPPRCFHWRRTTHTIVRYEGPERIAAEWWRRADNAGLTRDYYRVEDTSGRRFWVFRNGLYREKDDPRWYMHGLFA